MLSRFLTMLGTPTTNYGSSSSSDMGDSDCDIVYLEEGPSAPTPTNAISSSSTSSTTDVNNEDDENQSPILLEVDSPATLAEGYVFWVTTTAPSHNWDDTHSCDSPLISPSYQSISFPVQVPPGGVVVGDTLRVPLLTHQFEEHRSFDFAGNIDSSTSITSFHADELIDTASGQWKDGICSCLKLGLFHPDLWHACLCPEVLLGKILVRTNLTSVAHDRQGPNGRETENGHHSKPTTEPEASRALSAYQWTFRILLCLVVTSTLKIILYGPPMTVSSHAYQSGDPIYHLNDNHNTLILKPWDFFCWQQLLSIWGLVVMVRLRKSIRERYNIPPTRICNLSFGSSEDLVCSLCFSCCAMIQMARQTADYIEADAASCCITNGLRGDDSNEPHSTLHNGKDDGTNRKKVRQISPHSKEESHITPPSPSHSLASDNPYLRYRWISSPSSSSYESEMKLSVC